MKLFKLVAVFVLLLVIAGSAFAQKRLNQIEIFLGGAVPLAPESFKDAFQVGGSLHGQYVIFPSPRFGISFGLAFEGFTTKEEFGDADLSVAEIGVGFRPYLSSLESSTQFFLFAMPTFNFVEIDVAGFGSAEESKPGIAAGAGFEFPAGGKFNIILQGVGRAIFIEDETLSFFGITAGLILIK